MAATTKSCCGTKEREAASFLKGLDGGLRIQRGVSLLIEDD
jgi:hypothetical protein